MKYGRSSGVDFGPVDFVKYAESFGAKGFRANSKESFEQLLQEAFTEAQNGPVLIDVPIDYKDNISLGETILPDEFYQKRKLCQKRLNFFNTIRSVL